MTRTVCSLLPPLVPVPQLWAPVIPVLFGAAFVRRRHREQREQRRLLPSMDAYGDSDTESDSDDEGAGPDPGAPGSLAPPPVGRDPKLDAELGDDTFDSRGVRRGHMRGRGLLPHRGYSLELALTRCAVCVTAAAAWPWHPPQLLLDHASRGVARVLAVSRRQVGAP